MVWYGPAYPKLEDLPRMQLSSVPQFLRLQLSASHASVFLCLHPLQTSSYPLTLPLQVIQRSIATFFRVQVQTSLEMAFPTIYFPAESPKGPPSTVSSLCAKRSSLEGIL